MFLKRRKKSYYSFNNLEKRAYELLDKKFSFGYKRLERDVEYSLSRGYITVKEYVFLVDLLIFYLKETLPFVYHSILSFISILFIVVLMVAYFMVMC